MVEWALNDKKQLYLRLIFFLHYRCYYGKSNKFWVANESKRKKIVFIHMYDEVLEFIST